MLLGVEASDSGDAMRADGAGSGVAPFVLELKSMVVFRGACAGTGCIQYRYAGS